MGTLMRVKTEMPTFLCKGQVEWSKPRSMLYMGLPLEMTTKLQVV